MFDMLVIAGIVYKLASMLAFMVPFMPFDMFKWCCMLCILPMGLAQVKTASNISSWGRMRNT